MAQLDVHAAGDHGPPWQVPHAHAYTSSWPSPGGDRGTMSNNAHHGYPDYPDYSGNQDWRAIPLSPSRPSPSPRRRRRGSDLPTRTAYSTFTAAPPSEAATRRRRPAVERAASVVFPPAPSSLRRTTSAVAAAATMGLPPTIPSLQRAFTAPMGKSSGKAFGGKASEKASEKASAKASVKSSGKSSGSRRTTSHHARHHRRHSTPDSRQTRRSSLSDSDGEEDDDTHVTRPMPEEDEQDNSTLLGKESTPLRGQRQQPGHRHIRHKRSSSSSWRGRTMRGRIPEKAPAVPEVDSEPGEDDEDDDEDDEDEEDEEEEEEEEEHGRLRRRTPSRHGRRSASRHTTATTRDYHDLARSVASRSKSRVRHPDGDDAFNPRVSSRQRAGRYCASELPATFGYESRREPGYNKHGYEFARRHLVLRSAETQPTLPSQATAPHSIGRPRRAASLFETPLGYGSPAGPSEKSPKRMTCVLCLEQPPPSCVVKLECGHRMCTSCLKRKFKASMADATQMPPRCCTSQAIPTRHAEPLFDADFKCAWNDAFRDHATARRIYCPSPHCQEWLNPASASTFPRDQDGEPVVRCSRCRIRVCFHCHGPGHAPHACHYDEAIMQHLAAVRAEGRQRCYKCKAVVERMAGQDRMVCRCGAESCMICGGKRGHCTCPVFAVDEDYRHRSSSRGFGDSGRRRETRPSSFTTLDPARMRPRSYEDEMSRLRQRTGDFSTDRLTRRMQSFRGLEDGEPDSYYREDSRARREAARPYAEDVDDHDHDHNAGADDEENRVARAPPRRRRSFVVEEEDYHPHYAATDVMPAVPQPPSPPPPPSLTPPALSAMSAPPAPPTPPTPPHPQQPPFQGHPRMHGPPHGGHYRQQQSPHHSPYTTPPFDRTLSGGQGGGGSGGGGGADYYMSNVARARGGHTDFETGRLADRFNTGPRAPGPLGPPGAGGPSMAPLPRMGPISHMPSMQSMHSMAAVPPPMLSMGHPYPPPPMGGLPMMPMGPGVAVPVGGLYGGPELHGGMFSGSRYGDAYDDAYEEPYGEAYDEVYEDQYEVPMPEGGSSSSGRRRRRRRDAEAADPRPAHVLAGLAGPGRGIMDRVPSWLEYVDPGMPGERVASY